MSRWPRVQRYILWGLGLVIVLAIGGEILLRTLYVGSLQLPTYTQVDLLRVPHPLKGWDLNPDASAMLVASTYTSMVNINSQGLRDVEHEPGPSPNFRIVVLGDSYMDAYQLPMSGIFSRRLEHELRDYDVEVINLGVGGYGLAQSYLSLVEKGRRYEPDMVLLAMSPLNDVRNSSAELQRLFVGEKDMTYVLRPYPSFNQAGEVEIAAPQPTLTTMARRARYQRERESKRRPWWTRSLTTRLLAAQVARLINVPPPIPEDPLVAHHPLFRPEGLPSSDPTGTLWRDAERITRQMVLEIARVTGEGNAVFGVVVIPERVQVDPQFRSLVLRNPSPSSIDIGRPNRQFAGFAEANDIWLMDLLTIFLKQPSAPSLYIGAADFHWSRAGHQLAASEVARSVSERVRSLAAERE